MSAAEILSPSSHPDCALRALDNIRGEVMIEAAEVSFTRCRRALGLSLIDRSRHYHTMSVISSDTLDQGNKTGIFRVKRATK